MSNNITKTLPFGGPDDEGNRPGGVDLDGKPFTISDLHFRSTQNLIPDRDGHLVRRGAMSYQSQLTARNLATTSLHQGRAVADGSELTQSSVPIWLGIPSIKSGLYVFATASGGNRMDLGFSMPSKVIAECICANAVLTAPDSLPTMVEGPDSEVYVVWGDNPYGKPGLKLVTQAASPGFAISDFDWTNTQYLHTYPRVCTTTRQRVIWGGFSAEGYENAIVIGDFDDPLTIGENALTDRSLFVGGKVDGRLTAVHTVSLVNGGSPLQTGTLCLTQHSAFMLLGDAPETDDVNWPPPALELNRFQAKAGCVSQGTVADTPWGTIWCGPDNVWFLPVGAPNPVPIGRKLRPLLKGQPQSQAFRIHAVYHDGFYRLSLFSPAQGPNHETPLGEQWWLDLRDGPPESWSKARWYGPQIFNVAGALLPTARGDNTTVVGTSYMVSDKRDGQENVLVGVQYGVAPFSTTAFPLYLPNLVSYGDIGERDISGIFYSGLVPWRNNTVYEAGDEVVVLAARGALHGARFRVFSNGTPGSGTSGSTEPAWDLTGSDVIDGLITWIFIGYVFTPATVLGSEALVGFDSKEYDFGSRVTQKLFVGLEASILTSVPERATITQLLDTGIAQNVMTGNLDAMNGTNVGEDYLETGTFLTEEYNAYMFYDSEDNRSLGKTGQYQFREVAGILLPGSETDGFVFTVSVNFVVYSFTLSAKFYATATALATAVAAAINADSTWVAAFGAASVTVHTFTGLIEINGPNLISNGVSTAIDRFIWSILGLSAVDNSDSVHAGRLTGNEIPYDYAIGDFGIAEATAYVTAFKRRPSNE